MLMEYIDEAMARAKYEILTDDRSFYGEIPGFRGVYANASNLETCRAELQETLEEWLLVRLRRNLSIPSLKGASLKLKKLPHGRSQAHLMD